MLVLKKIVYLNKQTIKQTLKTKTMKTNVNYNGWTNYATWRVSLEVFDGYDFEDYSPQEITATFCQDWAEELIFQNSNDDLLASYAHAFLSDVNWYEIAESIRETLEEINEYKN